jgi:hypothetical protein
LTSKWRVEFGGEGEAKKLLVDDAVCAVKSAPKDPPKREMTGRWYGNGMEYGWTG